MLSRPAILYDPTLCTACRACQVACKQWNNLPAEETDWFQGESYTNPGGVSADTWLLLEMHEEAIAGEKLLWTFIQRRCHHCIDPVCVRNCPAEPRAASRDEHGIVTIDPDLCIGCGTCEASCPFNVPHVSEKYQVARKCTMCLDRQSKGGQPACAKTCPTGATLFGEREELIRIGRQRARQFEKGYLYGETEGGGSAVLYVLPYGVEFAGFPKAPESQVRRRTPASSKTDILAAIHGTGPAFLGLFTMGLSKLGERKQRVQKRRASGILNEADD